MFISVSWACIVLIGLCFGRLLAQVHELVSILQPGACVAGIPCHLQPTIAVAIRRTGLIDYAFNGWLSVSLATSPTGREKLFVGNGCHIGNSSLSSYCGEEILGQDGYSVPIITGIATFQHLTLKTVGAGYSFRYVGRTLDGDNFASLISSTFNVLGGSAYRLLLATPIGNALGGQAFASNPVVAIADRGDNVVTSVSSGYLTVSLVMIPSQYLNVTLQRIAIKTLTAPIIQGVANFSGLFINEAGYPYQILFVHSEGLYPSVVSNYFEVAVGPPCQLTFSNTTNPSNRTYAGGEFFPRPPTIYLLDAGGNLVFTDSTSMVQVSVKDNPGQGSIGPPSQINQTVTRGVAQFSCLFIDRAGINYTLRFDLWTYSPLLNRYLPTNITLISARFHVVAGPARKLEVVRKASGAWAGNQGFWQQPVVMVTDYGGNVLLNDMISEAQMLMTSSLSTTSTQIVIDTTDMSSVNFDQMRLNVANGSYGAGENIIFNLSCRYRVTVIPSTHHAFPFLQLDAKNLLTGKYARAELVAEGIMDTYWLLFRYLPQPYDQYDPSSALFSSPGKLLNTSSLHLNGSRIVDANQHDVNPQLPAYMPWDIVIESQPPRIVNLTCNTSSGEYGAGQIIDFVVWYDQPVAVQHLPYLLLNVSNAPNISGIGTPLVPAIFAGQEEGEQGYGVVFRYNVGLNDTTIGISPSTSPYLNLRINEILYPNATVYNLFLSNQSYNNSGFLTYEYGQYNFSKVDAWIRRKSTNPTTNVNTTIPEQVLSYFLSNYALIIDTSPPRLNFSYGLRSNHSAGTVYPGELVYLTMQFDQAVRVQGVGIRLKLAVGTVPAGRNRAFGFANVHRLWPDDLTLEFIYTVESFINVSRLDLVGDIDGLEITGQEAFIRRASTYPLKDANISTTDYYRPENHHLSNQTPISIHGFPFAPLDAYLINHSNNSGNLYPDDILAIQVDFPGPVVANCSPIFVLELDVGSREAVYAAGNGSSQLITFNYTIQIGDSLASSSYLIYRDTPSSLCSTSGCPSATSCAILMRSSNPTLPIDLRLPRASNTFPHILATNMSISPTNPTRNTSIASIRFLSAGGEYGAGSVIRISVTFSDPVIFVRSNRRISLPRLRLNLNHSLGFASLTSGNYDREWLFTYITKSNDSLMEVDLAAQIVDNLSPSTVIYCMNQSNHGLVSCPLVNYAGQKVDTNLTGQESSGIRIDTTPPAIQSIQLTILPVESHYSLARNQSIVYRGGEAIHISIYSTKPVIVGGLAPRIYLQLAPNYPVAIYNDQLSTSINLVFTYITRTGEEARWENFSVLGHAIDMNQGFSQIYRRSEIPMTSMNVTFPPALLANLSVNFSVAGSTSHIHQAYINAVNVGFVTSIGFYPLNSLPDINQRRFTVGDHLYIAISFNTEVVALGHSHIALQGGGHITYAEYIGYLPRNASVYDAPPTNFTRPFADEEVYFIPAHFNLPSPPTTVLIYRYDVQAGDYNHRLDYIDVASLSTQLTDDHDPAYIHCYVGDLAMNVDLFLPDPYLTNGSLSQGGQIEASIDGYPPHLVSFSFYQMSSNVYSVNHSILIALNFSHPVAIKLSDHHESQIPYLCIETHTFIKGRAYYSYTTEDHYALIFEYIPQPGDRSHYLEYCYDSSLSMPTTSTAYFPENSTIYAYAHHLKLPVPLHINTPYGRLQYNYQNAVGGRIQAMHGEYHFLDHFIDYPGRMYELRYEANFPSNFAYIMNEDNFWITARLDSNLTGNSTRNNTQGNWTYSISDDQYNNYYFTYLNNLYHNQSYSLSTSQLIYVSPSSEQQLRPRQAIREEAIGQAVAIQGDLAILGAPNFNKSVTTVQQVDITLADGLPQQEIQLIQTSITPQPAIQTFHTSAGIDQAVGGFFMLTYEIYGPTQPIPFDVDAASLQSILAFDLPILGPVAITRTPFVFCACDNAFSWTLTFNAYTEGSMSLVVTNGDALTGGGVLITPSTMKQPPSSLKGTFKLGLFGRWSNPIPYNANVSTVARAITSLGPEVTNVQVSPTTITQTRTWTVTFGAYKDSFEINLLESDPSGLYGGLNPSVTTQIARPGRHGPFGISGYFQLSWRGNTTTRMRSNVTAVAMKAALEALPVINTVNVERITHREDIGAYGWIIEFVSVNIHNTRGYYVMERLTNLEPIQSINHLIATDVEVVVDAIWSINSEPSVAKATRQGRFGLGAGAVFVYQRMNKHWEEVSFIQANDTEEGNRFGGSVALHDGVLLVGAMGANMNGHPHRVAIYCNADNGVFRISFRGWQTDPIPWNVTMNEFVDYVVAPTNEFRNLYSVAAISLEGYHGEVPAGSYLPDIPMISPSTIPICSNNTMILTFYSPVDGAPQLLNGYDGRSQLEPFVLESISLTYNHSIASASLTTYAFQNGTWRVHGADSDPQQIGAAYIYRLSRNCSEYVSLNHFNLSCKKNSWPLERQLFPLIYNIGHSNQSYFRVNNRYGHAVALSNPVGIITAPGTRNNSGVAYLYEYDSSAQNWQFLQMLAEPSSGGFISGNAFFGHAVAIHKNLIAISTLPIYRESGYVYLFFRPDSGGVFNAKQTLLAPNLIIDGVLFGYSIAMDAYTLAIGAPNFNDQSIGLGERLSSEAHKATGAVFLFRYSASLNRHVLVQKLVPSNLQSYDRFGHALALDSSVLIASSFQDFSDDKLSNSSRLILQIESFAAYNHTPLSGTFRILCGLQSLSSSQNFSLNYASTKDLDYNITALHLKEAFESSFPFGHVAVRRSRIDQFNRGFVWLVTLLQYDPYSTRIPSCKADTRYLLGRNATVKLNYISNPGQPLRNQVHVFQSSTPSMGSLEGLTARFTEQLILSPHRYQPQDRCGNDVAISGRFALVGCPHRDQAFAGQISGIGMLYDLGVLALQLNYSSAATVSPTTQPVVTEGDTVNVEVSVDRTFASMLQSYDENGDEEVLLYLQTIDKNSDYTLASDLTDVSSVLLSQIASPHSQDYENYLQEMIEYADFTISFQQWFAHRYDIVNTSLSYPHESIIEKTGLSGQAGAQSQFYGSNDSFTSRWYRGRYDYRGSIDYVPLRSMIYFASSSPTHSVVDRSIQTIGDSIVELPRESFSIALTSPGLWPSPIGKFLVRVALEDKSTGFSLNQTRYEQFIPDSAATSSEDAYPPSTSDLVNVEQGLGDTVAVHESCGYLFISTKTSLSAPKIKQYHLLPEHNSSWNRHLPDLSSPVGSSSIDTADFGAALAISCQPRRSLSFLVVSQPSSNQVFSYISTRSSFANHLFTLHSTLDVSQAYLPSHRFGERHAVAMTDELLVIGAPGLEMIFVYRLEYIPYQDAWQWSTTPQSIRSSHFDYDVIDFRPVLHRQGFGSAIACSGRTIVVGAPFADYDNQGTYLIENFNTEGLSISSLGKGLVFVFTSQPAVYRYCITASEPLTQGEYRLNYTHYNRTTMTSKLQFNSTSAELQAALDDLENIDFVIADSLGNSQPMSMNSSNLNQSVGPISYCYEINFYSSWTDAGDILLLYRDAGCNNCDPFNSSYFVSVTGGWKHRISALTEVDTISAPQGRQGDRFGASLDLDDHVLVVGAPYASGLTTTTWDFETGDLLGWYASEGHAFDHQPTYGDNVYYRYDQSLPASYTTFTDGSSRATNSLNYSTIDPNNQFNASHSSTGVLSPNAIRQALHRTTSGLRGHYYLSTYELRPGHPLDPLQPHPDYPPGNIQGHEPTGSLTSDTFLILGKNIQFLVGGGCDIQHLHIDLLIDGEVVQQVTGPCQETMSWQSFDVSAYCERSARIRVVDHASSGPFGYLSLDEIQFDWATNGGQLPLSGTDSAFISPATRLGGKQETRLVGTAYVFHRKFDDLISQHHYLCNHSVEAQCAWKFTTRLQPSDCRSYLQFGSQIALSNHGRFLAISSKASTPQLLYDDDLGYSQDGHVYLDQVYGIDFPIIDSSMTQYSTFDAYWGQSSGRKTVWQLEGKYNGIAEGSEYNLEDQNEYGGAVYFYALQPARVTFDGQLLAEESWPSGAETARLMAVDAQPGDKFGQGLALNGMTAVVGAPGKKFVNDASLGSAYLYRMEFMAIRFLKTQFAVVEGPKAVATITLNRDPAISNLRLVLEYATSDLTARGMDSEMFDVCESLNVAQRWSLLRCGDYEQSSGWLVWEPGMTSSGFTVRIMNNDCYNPRSKFIQLSLSIPGSGPLRGEGLQAMIRIDDDDDPNTSRHDCI